MKTLSEHLGTYATYHRDRRNIATHFAGIPMIVVATATLLSRPGFELAGVALSPAIPVILASVVFYLILDVRYGLVMAILLALAVWAGAFFAAQTTPIWLLAGAGGFAVGWVIQFVGHIFEGRKPAFVDDLVGLLIGPLFIVAEAGFALGLGKGVQRDVEAVAGPTRSGRTDSAARDPTRAAV